MATNTENAILKIKLSGALKEAIIKTYGAACYLDDGTTVEDKIASILVDIKELPTDTGIDAKIKTATDELYNKIMGTTDGSTTIDEAYDTLKEVAEWITEHGTAAAALTNDVSGLKTDVTALQTAMNNLVEFTQAEKTKLAGIEEGAQVNTVTGVKGNSESSYRTGNINITKANIGLGNVDNTSDADKPVSTATQAALDDKVDAVDGMGLSTNDYTDAEKTKLAGISEGANAYTHPTYTARTGVPTSNQTPAFGGTFTISQPVSDATGHITAINSRTVTVPSAVATTSAAGLMSAADKTALDTMPIVYTGETEPSDMKDGDVWFQTV